MAPGAGVATLAIFHLNTAAKPGEVVSIQGTFSASAQVYLHVEQGAGSKYIVVLMWSDNHYLVQLPTTLPLSLYQLWLADNG